MQNLCFGPECTISGYRTSGKKFRYELTQFTSLDPKWCLRVFRSISQTFGIKNDEKLIFRAWMQYFGVSNLRKSFVRNASNLLTLDPKWCLEVFRSISQIFTMKNDGNFVLGMNALFHSTELPKKVCYERIQSTPLDPKLCLGVFLSISQTFGMKNDAKLVFRAWMHNFEVLNFQKGFATNAFNLLH